jgi:hypothetical protein
MGVTVLFCTLAFSPIACPNKSKIRITMFSSAATGLKNSTTRIEKYDAGQTSKRGAGEDLQEQQLSPSD